MLDKCVVQVCVISRCVCVCGCVVACQDRRVIYLGAVGLMFILASIESGPLLCLLPIHSAGHTEGSSPPRHEGRGVGARARGQDVLRATTLSML